MSTTAIAASNAYRRKVAQAAATGTALPRISHLAFGTGSRPYSLDDTALQTEFTRIAADVTVSGVTVKAFATLPGAIVGVRVLREVAAFASDGTLIGRRVITPKEFEPETEMDFELTFQY
ncbi:hypothetical protein GHO35_13405 [Pseudomonas helleri]|uniref:hypothetical protein n=1 Tax=Pseudomonas helleri TaxID=1608996 RepID=UPI0012968EFF|nr:hypothetical protein [Pseudomonas helleri]MQU22136.1 hypothetical protein [Pseudomonas helleri]